MLHIIAQQFDKHQLEIKKFLKEKTKNLTPPLFLSCDIRSSGHKMGVIDTNLFPAGFNNLCNTYSKITENAFRRYFNKLYPHVSNVILLAEEHTRNRFYLENIFRLKQLLSDSGLNVSCAYIGMNISEDFLEISLDGDKKLSLHKLKVENAVPSAGGIVGDLVISNNDFSQGIPEKLLPLQNKIIPSPHLGWHERRKSNHFQKLQSVIEEFSKVCDLDPWLISCQFRKEMNVDLNQDKDRQRLAIQVEHTLNDIQKSFDKNSIQDSPYVYIKNDAGTYGMGLMDVSDSQEVVQLNRKARNKLHSMKGGGKADNFLIQEGIPTADFYSEFPIEPVIYMVGFEPVGGFFRMNAQQDAHSSLNSRGMMFSCLCLHKIDEPHEVPFLNCTEKANLVKMSMILARLAAIAAAQEFEETKN